MQRVRFACLSFLAVLGPLASGCLPSIADLGEGPLTETFAVSDYFAPSGYMGDGQYLGKLTGTPGVGCRPRAGLARGNCYAFTYLPNNNNTEAWAGVFWVFPSNSWGSTRGRAIDVAKFKQISFWAAIDGPSPYLDHGMTVPFQGQAGGINPKGGYANKGGTDFTDALEVKYGWQVGSPEGVTNEMKQFRIPLTQVEKSVNCINSETALATHKAANCTSDDPATAVAKYVIGAFAFAVAYPTSAAPCVDPAVDCHIGLNSSMYFNPPPVKIYLDDIVWSTEEPPAP